MSVCPPKNVWLVCHGQSEYEHALQSMSKYFTVDFWKSGIVIKDPLLSRYVLDSFIKVLYEKRFLQNQTCIKVSFYWFLGWIISFRSSSELQWPLEVSWREMNEIFQTRSCGAEDSKNTTYSWKENFRPKIQSLRFDVNSLYTDFRVTGSKHSPH